MDITDFTKQQGTFLKAENVKNKPIAEIIGEAEVKHNEKYDVDRLHIPVKLDGKEFVFDCSKTNARIIEEKLGKDTKTWIGKILELEIYKTKTSNGEMVEAINVKEVK